MRRIQQSDLEINRPLPWPLYDEYGNLLLREGYVISIPRHLDSLLKRGAYIKTTTFKKPAVSENFAPVMESAQLSFRAKALPPPPSVFLKAESLAHSLNRLHTHVREQALKIELRTIVRSLANMLIQSCSEDPDALLAAFYLDRQSPYLVIQQLLGCALTEIAAREINLDEATRLSLACAGLTRDIALLPWQNQLDTQTYPLDAQQNALIKVHPLRSAEILTAHGVDDLLWLEFVCQHHERIDGSGYPRALKGEAILPGARLLAIADSYSAMVTPRPNRQGKPPKDALMSLYLQRSSLYDEELLRVAVSALTTFPPGTMVRLANGELAVVRNRQKKDASQTLWALYDKSGMPIMNPQIRDTSDPAYAITNVMRVEECRSAALVMKRLWTRN